MYVCIVPKEIHHWVSVWLYPACYQRTTVGCNWLWNSLCSRSSEMNTCNKPNLQQMCSRTFPYWMTDFRSFSTFPQGNPENYNNNRKLLSFIVMLDYKASSCGNPPLGLPYHSHTYTPSSHCVFMWVEETHVRTLERLKYKNRKVIPPESVLWFIIV